jgi:hypothetical protein
MSRTYRFRHDDWKINSNNVLSDWDRRCDQYNPEDYEINRCDNYGIRNWYKIVFYANGKEGKKRLAKFRSDAKCRYWNHRGPGWFHNLFSQRPYRRDAKNQIKLYIDNDIDVQLLRKPTREYWD